MANRKTRCTRVAFWLILTMGAPHSFAQRQEAPLKVFGYFQNSLQHWQAFTYQPAQNSFSLQQLNLFFQKDLGRNWTAFINFEALNNFSSSHRWGALNLEEAWVKYAAGTKFNLKLGLQTPAFNNLNEIKNRTPLLPYIIRPLVYETSFGEFLPLEDFVPARAYVQAYGFLPVSETKFDYAVYLGNSRNINEEREKGQTGIDTTTTFLVGGRVGVRYREFKMGFSATYENVNEFMQLADSIGRQPAELKELPIKRFGGDLSYNFARFSIEGEFIKAHVETGLPELEFALAFYYATLGYNFTNALLGYGSYWFTDVHATVLNPDRGAKRDEEIPVSTLGLAYDLTERIRLKGQWSGVTDKEKINFITQNRVENKQAKFNVWAIAVSVVF